MFSDEAHYHLYGYANKHIASYNIKSSSESQDTITCTCSQAASFGLTFLKTMKTGLSMINAIDA